MDSENPFSVNEWNENTIYKASRGIALEDILEFINSVKKGLNITDNDHFKSISDLIQQMANSCDEDGLSNLVKFTSEKTSNLAIFHCIKDKGGTVSVAYALHRITYEMKNGQTDTGLGDLLKYQQKTAENSLKSLGFQVQYKDMIRNSPGEQITSHLNMPTSNILTVNETVPVLEPLETFDVDVHDWSTPELLKVDEIQKVGPRDKFGSQNVNILLLGQTGVGKSTFINGFANYLTYNTLEEAENDEHFISPISTQFTVTDEETFEMKTIVTGDANQMQAQALGQTTTQNVKPYTFNNGDLMVRLIDTPGIGDIRGEEQDKQNFKQILSYISKYDEIHGICILLKPNESKIDNMFKYCITELINNLHRSVTSNIVFCFTNARITNYKPGDTMVPLKQTLRDQGLEDLIKIRKDIVFCMDNESFIYLAAVKKGINFEKQDRDIFATSWKRSRMTCETMVNFFRNLNPYERRNTLSINETSRMVLEIMKPLAEMMKHIQTQIDVMVEQIAEIEKEAMDIKDIHKKFGSPIGPAFVLEREELENPKTVCTSQKCSRSNLEPHVHVPFKNCLQSPLINHCHSDCFINDTVPYTINNSDLKKCNVFDTSTGNCRHCGCDWSRHMYITYEMKEIKQNVNPEVKYHHTSKSDMKKEVDLYITKSRKKIEDMRKEEEFILKTSAKFGWFLKNDTISTSDPYNDPMVAHIIHQIKEDFQKIKMAGKNGRFFVSKSSRIKKNLEETISRYKKEIEEIENRKDEITHANIKQLQQDLFCLPTFGENLRKIHSDIVEERKSKAYNTDPGYYCKSKPYNNPRKNKFSWWLRGARVH